MSTFGIRRWFARQFLTTVRPALHNRHGGRVLTTEEWEASGGWEGAMVWGWLVERPDWWRLGVRSGVTAATVEEATASLDEWQDELCRRRR